MNVIRSTSHALRFSWPLVLLFIEPSTAIFRVVMHTGALSPRRARERGLARE